jgi:uncharacterized protein (DUF1778 family)
MKTFKQFLEAAGDPIKPEQVIKLGPEEMKNLSNAISKPPQPTPKPDRIRQSIQKMLANTLLTPL